MTHHSHDRVYADSERLLMLPYLALKKAIEVSDITSVELKLSHSRLSYNLHTIVITPCRA